MGGRARRARIARRASVRFAGGANGIDGARLHHHDFVVRGRREGFRRRGFRRGNAGTGSGETAAESAFATDESRRRGKNQEGNDQRLFHSALA